MNSFRIPSNMHLPAETMEKSASNSVEKKMKNTEERRDCKSTCYTLSVSDNGVGIPENIDIEDLESLGLQLVTSLVDQLDGELELKRNNGTEFTMKFIVTEKNNQ